MIPACGAAGRDQPPRKEPMTASADRRYRRPRRDLL